MDWEKFFWITPFDIVSLILSKWNEPRSQEALDRYFSKAFNKITKQIDFCQEWIDQYRNIIGEDIQEVVDHYREIADDDIFLYGVAQSDLQLLDDQTVKFIFEADPDTLCESVGEQSDLPAYVVDHILDSKEPHKFTRMLLDTKDLQPYQLDNMARHVLFEWREQVSQKERNIYRLSSESRLLLYEDPNTIIRDYLQSYGFGLGSHGIANDARKILKMIQPDIDVTIFPNDWIITQIPYICEWIRSRSE